MIGNNDLSKDQGVTFIPVTPGGTALIHLERKTEAEAIKALLKDAAHMPYGTWENFQKRGYEIARAEKP